MAPGDASGPDREETAAAVVETDIKGGVELSRLSTRVVVDLLERTAHSVGVDYVRGLIEAIAAGFDAHSVFVSQPLGGGSTRLRTVALWVEGTFVEPVEYESSGPFDRIRLGEMVLHESGVRLAYPDDPWFAVHQIEGYVGLAVRDASGEVIASLGVCCTRPIEVDEKDHALLKLVASRCGRELSRSVDAQNTVVAEIARTLADLGPDRGVMARYVVRRVADTVGDGVLLHLVPDDQHGELELVAAAHHDPTVGPFLEQTIGAEPQRGDSGAAALVLSSGEALFQPRLSRPDRDETRPGHRRYMAEVGVSGRIIVPMRARGRIGGLLELIRDQGGAPYARADLLFVQEVADHAALALENAGLHDRAERARSRELQLASVSRDLAELPPDSDELGKFLVARTCELIGDGCVLMVAKPGSDRMEVLAIGHRDPSVAEAIADMFGERGLRSDEGLAAEVLRSGQAMLVAELEDESSEYHRFHPNYVDGVKQLGFRGYYVVPMRGRGGVVGLMAGGRLRTSSAYTAEDFTFVQDLADRAGLALENARLFEEADRVRRSEEALVLLGRDLAGLSPDIEAITDRVVTSVVDLIGDACSIFEVTPDGAGFVLVRAAHRDPDGRRMIVSMFEDRVLPVDEGFSAHVLASGEPWFVPDVDVDFERVEAMAAYEQAASVFDWRGYFIIPLFGRGGRPVGMLVGYRSRASGPYKPGDEVFLQGVADSAALALENARTFRSVESAWTRSELLAQVTADMAQAGPDACAAAAAVACRLSDAMGDMVVIRRLNADGSGLEYVAGASRDPEALDLWEREVAVDVQGVDGDILGGMVASGDPVMIPDLDVEMIRPHLRAGLTKFVDKFGISGLIAAPMHVHDKVTGAVAVLRHAGSERFNTDDLALVEEAADRVGLALDNVAFYESEARATARTVRLAELARSLAGVGTDATASTQCLVEHLADWIGEAATFCTVSDDGEWVLPVAFSHRDPAMTEAMTEAMAGRRQHRAQGLMGEVFDSGDSLLIADFDSVSPERLLPEYRQYAQFLGAVMVVPLEARGRFVGVLQMIRSKGSPSFTAEDLDFVEQAARHSALALDNARLLEAATAAQQRLTHLAEISHSLAGIGPDRGAIGQFVATRLAETVGDAVFVRTLGPDGASLVPIGVANTEAEAVPMMEDLLANEQQRVDEGFAARLFQSGDAVFVPVLTPEVVSATLKPEYMPYVERWGLTSLITAAMRSRGGVVGAVQLGRNDGSPAYTEDDLRFAQEVADRAGQAVENADLMRSLVAEEARVRQLAEQTPAILWSTDADLVVRSVQGHGLDASGLSVDDVLDLPIGTTGSSESLPAHERAMSGSPSDYSLELGGRFYAAHVAPMRDPDGEIVGCIGLAIDVTERDEAVSALRLSEERFRRLAENAPDLIFRLRIAEGDARIEYVSLAVEAMTGMSVEAALESGFDLIHQDDQELVLRYLQDVGGQDPLRLRFVRTDGTSAWAEIRVVRLPDDDGLVVEGIARDVSDLVEMEQRLSHHALHDPLTSMANRHLFLDHLDQAQAKRRPEPQSVAVMIADLDRFKVVNDSLGHDAGDTLLVEVAARLQATLRPSDVVARLGGDEFAVLLEDLPEPEEAVRVAQRIGEALAEPFDIGETEVFTSASIGIAFAQDESDRAVDLLRHADTALYRAKAESGATYEIFDDDMRVQVQDRLHTETALRHAASRDEFWLAYQPVVDLSTGECHGAEALLRWTRAGRGPQAAGEFIRIAEESGLIIPIGRWVMWEACWFLARWGQEHPDIPMRVGVNLSPGQLRDPAFVGDVDDIVRQTGIDPTALWIEVTETMLMQDVDVTLERLMTLKKLGLRIAVDDFGTGYSSLAYLKRFPVDVLKVDKSFVDSIQVDPEDVAIVRATVQLAAALGLSVVAEGIETEEQRHALVMLGCTRGQGYHFAKPMPGSELSAYIMGSGYGAR